MSERSRYVIGIDLGTTNCALAYVDTLTLDPDEPTLAEPQMLAIPQVVAPGQVEPRPVLPSFLYLSAEGEFAAGALDLPWASARSFVVGEFARQHGVQVPSRLVSSAKSWLCFAGADRTGDILPFVPGGAPPQDVPRLSPVEASARYLAHLRDAWDHEVARGDEALRLHRQEVLLTVPASFDAVARELTVRAAQKAGFPVERLTLLEEPQAAFYAWLGRHQATWRDLLRVGDVVLVCDIGGGTTDFSLIAVADRDGELQLERIAVGDHILLGGDNMDLALGVMLLRQLEQQGHRLDAWQRRALVHSCRQAKEALLSAADLAAAPVVVLGRGSKVIGGSLKTELSRADVESLLVEGFFPIVPVGERPRAQRRAGLHEMGLPFAADAAVTRHLAKFVGDHRLPTSVLFNGGVMKALPLQRRIVEVLSSWGAAPRVLRGNDLDLAVAQGAAHYGIVRRGRGLRIRGGTARAYYIGVEASMPAVPGLSPPLRALCVAPRGMEEGTSLEVPGQELGLIVGEPVEFRFLASSVRRGDQVGDVIDEVTVDSGLEELAPVHTTLPAAEGEARVGTLVPVRLHSHLSEVGVLELFCVARDGQQRWKLEYDVRERRPSGEEAARAEGLA
ncbi:MAG: Hsp70 family protein [Myxococcales bacterium]|nr:Hsp70 family protein [Myxococcota bacterium]MDW8283129.1 Hsp70 family protein [Myxococcales bacterium]